VYLRDSDSPFDADRTAEIVNAIAASIAVS
jgi:hypothetical protein